MCGKLDILYCLIVDWAGQSIFHKTSCLRLRNLIPGNKFSNRKRRRPSLYDEPFARRNNNL